MRKNTIRFDDPSILNIFTDASTSKINNDVTTISAGYATVNNGIIIDSNFKVINDASNNYGELYAILLGVNSALMFNKSYSIINLFSDSEISVRSLRKWIFNWELSKNRFFKSNGYQVLNQELIHMIVDTIILNNLVINFYSQLGHIDEHNKKQVGKLKWFISKENDIDKLSDDDCKKIAYYNSFVDDMTRTNLHQVIRDRTFNDSNFQKRDFPVSLKMNRTFLRQYRNLIHE